MLWETAVGTRAWYQLSLAFKRQKTVMALTIQAQEENTSPRAYKQLTDGQLLVNEET